MTTAGGAFDQGCIFKTDENGDNQEIVYSFIGKTGSYPQNSRLCEAEDGTLYGILGDEDSPRSFIIFAFDPHTQFYRILNKRNKNMEFYDPVGSLVFGSNGHLFGVTTRGGQWNGGVIYELNQETGELIKKFDFNESTGQRPVSGLFASENGKLYGLTHTGGKYDQGVLYEYDISLNLYRKLHEFNLDLDGGFPKGTVLETSSGKLYGMTSTGGSYNDGSLFEFDIERSSFRKLLEFDGVESGSKPLGGLIEGPGEFLYGMTYGGGTWGLGVLLGYDIRKDSSFVLFHFDETSGKYPLGDLVITAERELLGMTSSGGKFGHGALFSFDLKTGEFYKQLDFQKSSTGNMPKGSLVIGKDRKCYGMTSEGGLYGRGVLFSYDRNNLLKKLVEFSMGEEGYAPVYLYANEQRHLYGATQKGGINDQGILFQYDVLNDKLFKLHDFEFDVSYLYPLYIMQASDKNLYGIVITDNMAKDGILYRYDINSGTYEEIQRFIVAKNITDSYYNISKPRGGVVEPIYGKIFGTTYFGSYENGGGIYEYDIYLKKYEAGYGIFEGGNLYGTLLPFTDCNLLYGVTVYGGMDNYGSIYYKNPFWNLHMFQCSQISKLLYQFEKGINGYYPRCTLIKGSNDNIYGTTSRGGKNDQGVLFEINTSTYYYNKKADFDSLNSGCFPEGSLLQSPNGKLYGTTTTGGTYDYGVLFEYDPDTEELTKKVEFEGYNGKHPKTSQLVIIDRNMIVTGINPDPANTISGIKIYPNPAREKLYIDLGKKYTSKLLEIITLQGKLLYSEIFENQQELELNIRQFNPGSYILILKGKNFRSAHKLIVQ